VAVVHGVGGMGKSELASTYAHRHAELYQGGTWQVDAHGHADLLEAVATLATVPALGLDATGQDRRAAGRRVLARLSELTLDARGRDDGSGACLLVLDDVSEPALLAERQLAELPPKPWFHVVATTRLGGADLAAGARRSIALLEVGTLAFDDALALIRERQRACDADRMVPDFSNPQEAESAAEIVRLLDGYPLAVEQAAVYLGATGTEPSQLVALLQELGLASLDAVGAAEEGVAAMRHPERLTATIVEQSVQRLPRRARMALAYASLLGPEAIPWEWLHQLTDAAAPAQPARLPGLSGGEDWASVRRLLDGRRLLTPTAGEHLVRLHRVLREHLRRQLVDDDIADRFDAYLAGESWRLHSQAVPDADLLAAAAAAFAERLGDGTYRLADSALVLLGAAKHRVDGATVDALTIALCRSYEHLVAARPGRGDYRRGLSRSLQERGERCQDRGDAQHAHEHYARAVGIDEQRVADVRDETRQSDLANSMTRLASFLGHHGDRPAAFASLGRARAIAEGLVAAHPDSVVYRRQLGGICERLGALHWEVHDDDTALGHFDRALSLSEQLAEERPGDLECQRDLLLALGRASPLRPPAERPGMCRRTLDIAERLADANPANAQRQRDKATALTAVAKQRGDAGRPALDHYRRAQRIIEVLADHDPQNMEYQRDLSNILTEIGDHLCSLGDTWSALETFQRCVTSDQQRLRRSPGNIQLRRDLSVSVERVADLRWELGDSAAALDDYHTAWQLLADIAAEDAQLRSRRELVTGTMKFALRLEAFGDATAVSMWECAYRNLWDLERAGDLPAEERWLLEAVATKVGARDCSEPRAFDP